MTMGKRGENLFKRLDALRALKAARDGGIEPAMIEIVAKDGTIFRVHGSKAAAETNPEVMSAKEWDDAISEMKAKKLKTRTGRQGE
jgi:hypothetical protein